MTDIRSYRRVFDFERRIYSVDRLRLNPGGVPVRGVVYLLALIGLATIAARLPLVGQALALLPWYLRELAFPAAAATVLAVIHVDGRAFHLAAWSLARLLGRPARVSALRHRSRRGMRWRPSPLLFLPDGSDPHLRAVRYSGPGAVRVNVAYCCASRARRVRRRGLLVLRPDRIASTARGQVIVLAPGSRLQVRTGRRA